MKKITSLQIFTMYSMSMFTTFTAFLENPLASSSKYSALLASLLGAFLAWLLIYPGLKVSQSRPDEFVVEYGHELVGKIPHTFFMIMVILVNIILGAGTIRQMSDFLLTEYLIGTPAWAVLLIFCLAVAYAVYSGLLTIFRAAQGIFLFSALSYFIIPFLALRELNKGMLPAFFTHITPAELGNGIYLNVGLFGEISFLFLLMPYLKAPQKAYRTIFAAILFAVVINILHMFLVLSAFGPEITANLSYPDLELTAFIQTGSFLQTGDPILIILWLTSLFVKICFIIFITSICISQVTKVKDHRIFTLSTTAFILILSMIMSRTQTELHDFLSMRLPGVMIAGEILIPIIYWIAYLIRSHASRRKQQQS
ncbi:MULTISPECIES: GerAB/ArcD/ProY family transporter [unclassified Paenibacillus]|uniref:GerAB/ArcD/ProY family transporter n=1 Tax=unclassified Paenibacillus TaxID=185978 RepID=UPI000839539A|nr:MULTISPECIES: GerAB/ArcD/ProY family transporter [unclassified Paenibacillus]NWL87167.1 hypothetical protein [Paenibacillus sp. 79R4]